MKEKIDSRWAGMLTVENIEEVAKLIFSLLEGKSYTFVSVNEIFRFKPESRSGQKLEKVSKKDKINVWYGENKKYAGFNFEDTYGVWGCDTHLRENIYDSKFENPYIEFNGNTITITHRAAGQNLIYWLIIIDE